MQRMVPFVLRCWVDVLLEIVKVGMSAVEKLSSIKPSSAALLQALQVYVKLTESN